MSTTRFATLTLLALTTAASANTVATDGITEREEPDKPLAKRLEGRLGMLLGGADVGDADGFSMGVNAGIGYRIGDATVRALFDHYRVGDSENETSMVRRGRGTRIGGAVRYSFANNNPDYEKSSGGLGLDFWGEAGMGYEHVAWRAGGVLDRPSAELAVGFDLDIYGRRKTGNHRSHLGYFMAFRTLIARGPEMEGPAVCGGPCTSATKPTRMDVSMFFEMGVHWGR